MVSIARFNRVLIVYFLLLASSHADASPIYKYDVVIPSDLSRFDVALCFSATPPQNLYLPDDADISQFRYISRGTPNKALKLLPVDQQVDLAGVKSGDCIGYTAKFNGEVTHRWFKSRQVTQQQIQLSLDQWLCLPTQHGGVALTVEFHLPAGFEVSSPGKLISSTEHSRVYRLRPRSDDLASVIAVGHFDKLIRSDKSARIEVALMEGHQPYDHAKIMQWVDANITALQQLYGDFPVPDLQLLVVPVGKDREPVPWGESTRGGGDAVHVYIDETQPLQALLSDWVLIHELSHLLHPSISDNGRWLSEGLASYYQNVLAARGGLITEKKAWDNLDAGFMRGVKGTPSGQTLAQVTQTIYKTHRFMRVYWSGAAISLLADTRLRRLSHNQQSLDSVLQQFAQCCLPADKEWTALALMQKFDDLSNTKIFTDLYTEYVDSTQFPLLQPTYLQLGLIPSGAHVALSATAPELAVRRAIMRRR